MAEHVQHPRVLRQRNHAIAVGALVEEPAGLLPAERIDREPHTALNHLRARVIAEQQVDVLCQPLLPPCRRVIACHHCAQRQQAGERLHDRRRQPIHPGGVRLQHRNIVVAVDHQARQPVGLGVHQPVEGRVANTVAQCDRLAKTRTQPVHVDLRRWVAIQQPRRDQAARIEHEGAESRAVVALNPNQVARRHLPILRLHQRARWRTPRASPPAAAVPGQG